MSYTIYESNVDEEHLFNNLCINCRSKTFSPQFMYQIIIKEPCPLQFKCQLLAKNMPTTILMPNFAQEHVLYNL